MQSGGIFVLLTPIGPNSAEVRQNEGGMVFGRKRSPFLFSLLCFEKPITPYHTTPPSLMHLGLLIHRKTT